MFRGTLPLPEQPHVLDVDDVTIELGGKRVIDRVSFWVPVGEFLCLCGPNGAGKSTLLKAILGLLAPSSGSIRIGGAEPRAGRSKVGYVPQRKSFDRDFPASPVEVIAANLRGRWPLRVRDDERAIALSVLERTGAAKLADAQMRDLSGVRQRFHSRDCDVFDVTDDGDFHRASVAGASLGRRHTLGACNRDCEILA